MAQYRAKLASDPGPRFKRCRDEASRILRKAADKWAEGHPEQPPTEQVLTAILKVFEDEQFLRRPF